MILPSQCYLRIFHLHDSDQHNGGRKPGNPREKPTAFYHDSWQSFKRPTGEETSSHWWKARGSLRWPSHLIIWPRITNDFLFELAFTSDSVLLSFPYTPVTSMKIEGSRTEPGETVDHVA